jgi:hypothetical protein
MIKGREGTCDKKSIRREKEKQKKNLKGNCLNGP